jgi:5S rRNA maturation endonuclease (ribonuclease M5)
MSSRIDPEDLRKCIGDLEGSLVIVEGRKDRKALKSLGVKNIMQLVGKPLAEFTVHVSKSYRTQKDTDWKEAVILTDFDSEGTRISAKLERLLRAYGVPVNKRLRKRFIRFGKGCIESFKEGDVHGKARADVYKVRRKGKHKGKGSS